MIIRCIALIFILMTFSVVAAHEDPEKLPVGDGKISDSPQQGFLWSCQTNAMGSGALAEGPWFNGDGTYNSLAKLVVDGSVTWPSEFDITIEGEERVFTGNSLPNHPTGVYPVARSDDVYPYDPNPNSISEQPLQLTLPAMPELADEPSCAPGSIGIMLTGSMLFNALDAQLRDAVAHEVQDNCDGHPQRTGVYHYHSLTSCLEDEREEDEHSALMGYAFDGFGIFGYYGENGELMSNETLDECHGHTHEISWDGELVEMYHYHATYEYPYTIGCFRGTPSISMRGGGQGGQQPPSNGGQQPGNGQQPPGQRPPGGQPPGNGQQPPGNGQRPPGG